MKEWYKLQRISVINIFGNDIIMWFLAIVYMTPYIWCFLGQYVLSLALCLIT